VSTAAPPTAQNAVLGSTIQATIESTGDDGNPVTGTASYTVSNLRPVEPTSYTDVKGTLYAVDVTVQSQTGTTLVHPWNFVLRTEDGTSLQPVLGGVDNELPAQDLPQGQKVSGPVPVDVPPGKTVAEIVLSNGIGGDQLGRWTVG
jgi:hypothetical protein